MSTVIRNACGPARVGVNSEARACVEKALRSLSSQPGPLLEILHAVQDGLGHVPHEAVPIIADSSPQL